MSIDGKGAATETPERGARRATIKDVAAAAGVSVTTVSNVLNQRTGAMSEETLERILLAVQALDYRPSGVARSLVHRRTATIGVVLAEIDTPLFLQALSVVEPAARGAGYNVLISSARHEQDEQQAIHLLLEKEIDGVLFLSTSTYTDDAHLRPLRTRGVPVVLVNRATDDEEFDRIDWDNAGGVEAAVAHLARLGHRRIAHVHGPRNRRSTAERLAGYRHALAEHGLEYREEYLRLGDYTAPPASWQDGVLELLSLPSPPTAIIASDDAVAAVVMRAIQRAGLRVPADMAMIGIDDQPFSAYLNPSLTTVRLPIPEAGAHAIELLLRRIGGEAAEPQRMVLPCTLVVRESCGEGEG